MSMLFFSAAMWSAVFPLPLRSLMLMSSEKIRYSLQGMRDGRTHAEKPLNNLRVLGGSGKMDAAHIAIVLRFDVGSLGDQVVNDGLLL